MPVSSMLSAAPRRSAQRHVTILFSDLVDFSAWTERLGDVVAGQLANRILDVQEVIITREDAGQVLKRVGDSIFAIFDAPSAALNRALEIQRVLDAPQIGSETRPSVRIGLHTGEVLVKEAEQIEIISRHVNRAHRVMEIARPGQILASDSVIEAARDFIDIPADALAIRHYGEFHLKGVGATPLCEVTDMRLREPQAPAVPEGRKTESVLARRLELAGYWDLTRVGEGAHGVVYRARRTAAGATGSNDPVAIKVFHNQASDVDYWLRLEQRLESLQRTPSSPRLLEKRLDHNPPFLVHEWIQGQPLDTALRGAAPARIAAVFAELCEQLNQAHTLGLVHGNIKPNNALLNDRDSPVLLDFGLADAAIPPASAGTPGCLAPEFLQGRLLTPAADIYGLGLLLFRTLTGRDPFLGETVHDLVQAHLHEDPPLPAQVHPAVPDGLQRICLKALEKNPAARYPSVQAMRADLDRVSRGELVRTRPTLYENLLFHRVHRHIDQIGTWARSGLLTTEEEHRLVAAYEGLERRGIPAVMETRIYRVWQTGVYAGGWALVNGALLWLIQQWETLGPLARISLGSIPALVAFGLGLRMWNAERFRLCFVSLVVAVLTVPLLTAVWLHEFGIAGEAVQLEHELFHVAAESQALTNRQILWAALATFLIAGLIMQRAGTVTHSTQTMLALAACYTALLFVFGLKTHLAADPIHWATVGLQYVPLLAALSWAARRLIQHPTRHYQGAPWVTGAAFLLVLIVYAVARYGLRDWLPTDAAYIDPASQLLLAAAGAGLIGLGLNLRQQLRHRCRLASLGVIVTGLSYLLVGLTIAGWTDIWPETWWRPAVLGQPVPGPHLMLPLVCVAITLLACRYQLFAFLLVGLGGLAASIHLLGELYFQQAAAWPKWILLLGALSFGSCLYVELRRTRGQPLDELVNTSRW